MPVENRPNRHKSNHTLTAQVLRQGREALGIPTQRALAAQLHMESATYSACENGQRAFPLARIPMLPEAMQLELKEAMIAEYALELDDRIAALHGRLPDPDSPISATKRPRKKKAVQKRAAGRRSKKRGLVAAE